MTAADGRAAATVDLGRIPDELLDELEQLLPIATQVQQTFEDFDARRQRLLARWSTSRHPQLARPDAPDRLDEDLADAAGVSAINGVANEGYAGSVTVDLDAAMQRLDVDDSQARPLAELEEHNAWARQELDRLQTAVDIAALALVQHSWRARAALADIPTE